MPSLANNNEGRRVISSLFTTNLDVVGCCQGVEKSHRRDIELVSGPLVCVENLHVEVSTVEFNFAGVKFGPLQLYLCE